MSITDYQVHLTLKSRNEKTGPIPVSTTERKCCPSTCPLKANGCYAEGGPLALNWRKIDAHTLGTGWAEFCEKIKALPEGTLWRHNQAGDLPSNGKFIDVEAFFMLIRANMGKRGFTFSHHDLSVPTNGDAIYDANVLGFTVNLSADNLEHADELSEAHVWRAGVRRTVGPVVTIVPEDFPAKGETPAGRKVAVCPAQVHEGVTCQSCQLCARSNRKVIVAFRVHGPQKKRAMHALNL